LVQWDTSDHDWLEGRGKRLYLIGMIDDATSRALARFVDSDSTAEKMGLLERWLLRHGHMQGCYTDKAGLFQTAPKTKRGEQREGVPALPGLRAGPAGTRGQGGLCAQKGSHANGQKAWMKDFMKKPGRSPSQAWGAPPLPAARGGKAKAPGTGKLSKRRDSTGMTESIGPM